MSADLFHSDNPIYHRRLLKHRVGILLSISAMAVGIFALLWILAVLIINGLSAIDIDMFTHTTPAPGSEGGGNGPSVSTMTSRQGSKSGFGR